MCASKFPEAENKAKRRGCSVCSVRLFTWVVLFVREGEDELVCFSRSLCVADEGAKKKAGRKNSGIVRVTLVSLWTARRG